MSDIANDKHIETVYKPENVEFIFGPFCSGCKTCSITIESQFTESIRREIICKFYHSCNYAYAKGIFDGMEEHEKHKEENA